MNILLVWIVISLILTLLWAIRGMKMNKDKRVVLYKQLMSKGCNKCNGKLALGDFTSQYMNIECERCGSKYQIDTTVEMAWEI